MQRTALWRVLWSAGLVATLLLVSSVAFAASPAQEGPVPPPGASGPVAPIETPAPKPPAEGEPGGVAGAAMQSLLAVPGPQMNYQGLLTDGAGVPLNGTYNLSFSLYNAATAGTKVWGEEAHNNVPVTKGLFQVVLGTTSALTPDMFTQQLYLQTTVGSVVLPRQMLHAVPYAMGLVAGSHSYGSTTNLNDYGLEVSNDGGRGLYVNAKDDGRIALYSADVIYSDEGYSGPPTYVWIAGETARLYQYSGSAHVETYYHGLGRIHPDADNQIVEAVFPVQLHQPYGRPFRVTNVTIYYLVNAPAFIDQVYVEGQRYDTLNYPDAELSDANGNSTTYAAYNVAVDPPFEVTSLQTVTDIKLLIRSGAPNGALGYVDVYGIRLTLASDY